MGKPILRFAKKADVEAVYGLPRHLRSLRAIVAELDGKVIGIGGYYYTKAFTIYAFANISDELKKYPVTLYKAGLYINQMFQKSGLVKVIAVADKDKEASGRFLEHLGYTKTGVTHDGDVYEWSPREN